MCVLHGTVVRGEKLDLLRESCFTYIPVQSAHRTTPLVPKVSRVCKSAGEKAVLLRWPRRRMHDIPPYKVSEDRTREKQSWAPTHCAHALMPNGDGVRRKQRSQAGGKPFPPSPGGPWLAWSGAQNVIRWALILNHSPVPVF